MNPFLTNNICVYLLIYFFNFSFIMSDGTGLTDYILLEFCVLFHLFSFSFDYIISIVLLIVALYSISGSLEGR